MARDEPNGVGGVLDAAADAPSKTNGQDEDVVTIGMIVDQFDRRSYGPLLLLVAIIAVGPTGAIPGMSIVTALMVIAICGQMLFGLDHIWLPDRLIDLEIPKKRLTRLVERAKPYTRWVDEHVGRRWVWLVEPPAIQVMALVCITLSLTMIPLALVPFAVAVPGSAIGVFGLALTAGDGRLAAAGYVLSTFALHLTWTSL